MALGRKKPSKFDTNAFVGEGTSVKFGGVEDAIKSMRPDKTFAEKAKLKFTKAAKEF